MMTIKAVLFDKDGTLIDVNGTWVPFYKAMLKQEQSLSDDAAEAKMVLAGFDPISKTFAAGSLLAGGTTRQLVDVWWPDTSRAEQNAITRRLDHDLAPLALSHMKPLMALAPVLSELKALGFLLGVATNDGEASAKGHMRALGVHDYFTLILGADSVAKPKPSGQMVRKFADHTGLECSEIAMVGDNLHDLEEAHEGGAGLAIGVLSGNGAMADLRAHADHVLNSVADLPVFLGSR
jgi:phosphoglycolate phosphatase